MDNYVLGKTAVNQLRQDHQIVQRLNKSSGSLRNPKQRVGGGTIYAQIIDTTGASDGFYDATQVIFDTSEFSTSEVGLLFNDTTDGVGRLKPFFDTGTKASIDQVFPVHFTGDNSGNGQWWFMPPQDGIRYAQIIDNTDSTDALYDATEVSYTGGSWSTFTGGLSFIDSTEEAGQLKSFNLDEKFALKIDSIHPVYRTQDGTDFQWWVNQPVVPDTTEIDVITHLRFSDTSNNELQCKSLPILAFVPDGSTYTDFTVVSGWDTDDCT